MNIAIINFDSVINAFSGTSKVFADMANALSRRGHKVYALGYDIRVGEPGFKFDDKVQFVNCCTGLYDRIFHNEGIAKLQTFYISDRKTRRIKRYKLELKAKSHSIARELYKTNADVIITFQQEITYMLMEIIGTKTPIISMIHSTPSYYFERPEFEDLFKPSMENCACVQVLMPQFIQEAKRFIPNQRIVSIPNVVPQFENMRSQIHEKKPIIVNVAQISPNKNQNLIAEAFSLLASKYPQWRVDLWGWNQNKFAKQLDQQIKELGMSDRVFIRGETDQVPQKLQEASIFVFPSLREGFCIALAEAMSMGLPVIGCKDCSAVSTLISDNESGLLCDNNAQDLANKIELLINNPDLRDKLGKNAQESMKRYSSDAVCDQWEKLIFSVANKPA